MQWVTHCKVVASDNVFKESMLAVVAKSKQKRNSVNKMVVDSLFVWLCLHYVHCPWSLSRGSLSIGFASIVAKKSLLAIECGSEDSSRSPLLRTRWDPRQTHTTVSNNDRGVTVIVINLWLKQMEFVLFPLLPSPSLWEWNPLPIIGSVIEFCCSIGKPIEPRWRISFDWSSIIIEAISLSQGLVYHTLFVTNAPR